MSYSARRTLTRRSLLAALGTVSFAPAAFAEQAKEDSKSDKAAGASDDAGASANSPPLEEIDLRVSGQVASRATLLVPKLAKQKPLRLLILLHGLGETVAESLGVRAWIDRYGLTSAYARLTSPPVKRTLERVKYLTDEFASDINASLEAEPFQGYAMLCPFTPNPSKHGSSSAALDEYTDWLVTRLLPQAAQRVELLDTPVARGIDGCSLGGYVALEVFLRKPELFGALGGIQAAIGMASAERYAAKLAQAIAKVGPRPIHLSTSTGDPYRRANAHLAEQLGTLGVPARLEVHPGPHNQPWLQEVGTLGLLRFFDRQLLDYPRR